MTVWPTPGDSLLQSAGGVERLLWIEPPDRSQQLPFSVACNHSRDPSAVLARRSSPALHHTRTTHDGVVPVSPTSQHSRDDSIGQRFRAAVPRDLFVLVRSVGSRHTIGGDRVLCG